MKKCIILLYMLSYLWHCNNCCFLIRKMSNVWKYGLFLFKGRNIWNHNKQNLSKSWCSRCIYLNPCWSTSLWRQLIYIWCILLHIWILEVSQPLTVSLARLQPLLWARCRLVGHVNSIPPDGSLYCRVIAKIFTATVVATSCYSHFSEGTCKVSLWSTFLQP